MTVQELEQRLNDLEQEVAALRREIKPSQALSTPQDTFGIFANDLEFDEIVRLGREYREEANAKDDEC
jgi:hypothetical protein